MMTKQIIQLAFKHTQAYLYKARFFLSTVPSAITSSCIMTNFLSYKPWYQHPHPPTIRYKRGRDRERRPIYKNTREIERQSQHSSVPRPA